MRIFKFFSDVNKNAGKCGVVCSSQALKNQKRIKVKHFTLLEVLVALVIASICLVVLLGGLSLNIRNSNLSKNYLTACLLAKKKLSDLEVAENVDVGVESGSFDGYNGYYWRSEITKKLMKKQPFYKVYLIVKFKTGSQMREIKFSTFKVNVEKEKKKKSDKGLENG